MLRWVLHLYQNLCLLTMSIWHHSAPGNSFLFWSTVGQKNWNRPENLDLKPNLNPNPKIYPYWILNSSTRKPEPEPEIPKILSKNPGIYLKNWVFTRKFGYRFQKRAPKSIPEPIQTRLDPNRNWTDILDSPYYWVLNFSTRRTRTRSGFTQTRTAYSNVHPYSRHYIIAIIKESKYLK